MSEAVSFKGNKDGIVLLLDLRVEFESLCQMIVQKLWDSRNFLGDHTALIINFLVFIFVAVCSNLSFITCECKAFWAENNTKT